MRTLILIAWLLALYCGAMAHVYQATKSEETKTYERCADDADSQECEALVQSGDL